MAISPFKTFVSGEVLTASDLNSSFTQITNNALSLISPLTGSLDVDGNILVMDSDADSSIRIATDDIFEMYLFGVRLLYMDGSAASLVNGLEFIPSATGVAVAIKPKGSDTNISLDLQSKGSGTVTINGASVAGITSDDAVFTTRIFN